MSHMMNPGSSEGYNTMRINRRTVRINQQMTPLHDCSQVSRKRRWLLGWQRNTLWVCLFTGLYWFGVVVLLDKANQSPGGRGKDELKGARQDVYINKQLINSIWLYNKTVNNVVQGLTFHSGKQREDGVRMRLHARVGGKLSKRVRNGITFSTGALKRPQEGQWQDGQGRLIGGTYRNVRVKKKHYRTIHSSAKRTFRAQKPESNVFISNRDQSHTFQNTVNGSSAYRSGSTSFNYSIPHIFHQMWDTEQVPGAFYIWIAGWLAAHPGWEYWFWTVRDARRLLQVHFPQYLTLYEGYSQRLMRADVLRYLVMYQYGGVYADLDVEVLRPMTDFVNSVECFLSEDTHVHTFLYYGANRTQIQNTVLGCRPGHPFYDLALRSLAEAAAAHPENEMKSTGPHFLDGVYQKFLKLNTSQLVVTHPDFFLPTYDPEAQELVMMECVHNYEQLSIRLKDVCRDPIKQEFRNKPKISSYTDHHWVHVSLWPEARRKADLVNITEIVPNLKHGTDMVDQRSKRKT